MWFLLHRAIVNSHILFYCVVIVYRVSIFASDNSSFYDAMLCG